MERSPFMKKNMGNREAFFYSAKSSVRGICVVIIKTIQNPRFSFQPAQQF